MYEGVYLPYPQTSPIPQSELVIDEKKMNLAQEQLFVEAPTDFQVVPIVYLRNGSVLIPAKTYEQGKQRMEELQRANNPNAPAQH